MATHGPWPRVINLEFALRAVSQAEQSGINHRCCTRKEQLLGHGGVWAAVPSLSLKVIRGSRYKKKKNGGRGGMRADPGHCGLTL